MPDPPPAGDPPAPASPTIVRLEVPPRSDHLALIRLVVSGALAIDRRLPERRLEDLRLAVTEASANAVEAQLASGVDRPVHIDIEVRPDAVTVTITDHAGGFDPDELAPLPAVTDPGRLGHEHGLGLGLIRSHVDAVEFVPTDDGTAVRLTMKAD